MASDRDRPSPLELFLAGQREMLASTAAALRRAAVAGDRVDDVLSAEVGATPSEVVYTENKLELRRYEALTESQHDIPVLVVYALINRPYILDLQRDRSVVRRLLEAGHDVYLVDWHEPSALDQHLTLYDYVARYVDNCVDVVRERSGRDAINVLGYCMGGTLAAIYTALNPAKVNALALLAPALHFDDTGGVLEKWGAADHFDPSAVTDAYGNVPGEFLAVGFAAMDPVANYVTKYVRMADRLENEDFVENFARMETWLSDGVDLAGATYVQFLEDVYQENKLTRNELRVDGERVDLGAIDVPVLQVLGTYDNLVPPAASEPFNDAVGSDDVTTIEYPSGHVGLAMSAGAHRDLWPEVAEWFLEQSPAPPLADVIAEGVESVLGVDVETDVTVGDADEVEIGIADDAGDIARAVVAHDARSIEAFLEDALDVEIGLDVGDRGIAVTVAHDGEVATVVVETVGEAVRREVEEAVENVDIAATYALEDVEGIGPTYGDRLREADIESVSELAVADPHAVADAARTSTAMARTWVDRAGALVNLGDAVEAG